MKSEFDPDSDHIARALRAAQIEQGLAKQDLIDSTPKQEMQQQQTPIWQSFIGEFVGGSPAKMLRTIGFVVWLLWITLGIVNVAKEDHLQVQRIPAMVAHDDSTRAYIAGEKDERDYARRILKPMTYKNNQVLRRKFPREPEWRNDQWGTTVGGNDNSN